MRWWEKRVLSCEDAAVRACHPCNYRGRRSCKSTSGWCLVRPFSIFFHPINSNYRTWLLLLSVVHHIPGFITKFLDAFTEFDTSPSMAGGWTKHKQFFINRIHFPHALLQNWENFGLNQNQTLSDWTKTRNGWSNVSTPLRTWVMCQHCVLG